MDLVTGSLTLWADLLQASATPPHAYLLPHYLAARRLFTLHPSTSGYLLSKAPALGYSDLPASVQFPTALKDLSCLCLSHLFWEVESAPGSAQSTLSCYTQVTGGCCGTVSCVSSVPAYRPLKASPLELLEGWKLCDRGPQGAQGPASLPRQLRTLQGPQRRASVDELEWTGGGGERREGGDMAETVGAFWASLWLRR